MRLNMFSQSRIAATQLIEQLANVSRFKAQFCNPSGEGLQFT